MEIFNFLLLYMNNHLLHGKITMMFVAAQNGLVLIRYIHVGEVSGIFETLLRTVIAFFVLLVLTRLIGKKQLGQLNVFTYITGIAIGSMAGEIVIHNDVDMIQGLAGLFLWSALVFVVEYVSLKSPKARVLLDGEPTIVVKKGQIVEKALRKQRMNIDDLTMMLRTNQIFSIIDVEYAILEPNGDMSIMKKSEKQAVTKEDMKFDTRNSGYIPTEIITDGCIVFANLKELGLSEKWLDEQLQVQNIHKKSDVLYAEFQTDGKLYIQLKEKKRM